MESGHQFVELRRLVTARKVGICRRLLRWILRIVSIPYVLAVACKNACYRLGVKKAFQPDIPTISVGNLSVGGTGKSPVVSWIAKRLRRQGIRVAVLSRGYGQLDSGQNDEALELELQHPDVPHLQHWDRIASAQLATEELQMQLLLLDDGFQHRRIARDLDIVLLDATDPPSARWPLPGGLLREPLNALGRAHVVVLTRADQAPTDELAQLQRVVARFARAAVCCTARHAPTQLWRFPDLKTPAEQIRGKRLLAFCAIGNPDSFFRSLENLGAKLIDRRVWPDHHGYTANDVEQLANWAETTADIDMIVCTMKDWVKLQVEEIGGVPLLALLVELELLSGEEQFTHALDRLCN